MNFVCPYCKDTLIAINDDFLECKDHGEFNIVNDFPVFFEIGLNDDTKYFQKHWENIEKERYPKAKIDVADSFLNSFIKNFDNKKILDAGCGDGVHLHYLSKRYKQSKLFGIDISMPALFKAKHNVENSTLCCASVDQLPFKDDYFDVSFSYGVLAYTPDPKKSFKELCRVTRKGGYIGVWFYPKPSLLNNLLLKLVRYLSGCCNKKLVNILANIIVPFLYILPTASKVNLSNATWAECKEVVLVNIAPQNLWYPTEDEIVELFKSNDIKIVHISKSSPITIWGVKNNDL